MKTYESNAFKKVLSDKRQADRSSLNDAISFASHKSQQTRHHRSQMIVGIMLTDRSWKDKIFLELLS
jgi:hypothetical protein